MPVMGCGAIGQRDLKSDFMGEMWQVAPVLRINGDSARSSTGVHKVEYATGSGVVSTSEVDRVCVDQSSDTCKGPLMIVKALNEWCSKPVPESGGKGVAIAVPAKSAGVDVGVEDDGVGGAE
jgi:hypothetical protein